MRFINMTGQRYGKLFIESFAGMKTSGNGSRSAWNCICDCSNKCIIDGYSIRSGNATSCGCIRNELSSKRRQVDLTGQRFAKLTVLEKAYTKNYKVYWKCQCDCGNICFVITSRLRNGTTKSCGCIIKDIMGPKLSVDITGQRSGKLTAITPTTMRTHRQIMWLCKCDCGGETYVNTTDFLNKHVISCGCVKSKGEETIAVWLSNHNIKYKKNYKLLDLYTTNKIGRKTRLPFDFGILDEEDKLICLIEYQGIQHYTSTSRNGFGDQQRLITDALKRDYCNNNHFPLEEIRYDENIEERLTKIIHTYVNPVGIAS